MPLFVRICCSFSSPVLLLSASARNIIPIHLLYITHITHTHTYFALDFQRFHSPLQFCNFFCVLRFNPKLNKLVYLSSSRAVTNRFRWNYNRTSAVALPFLRVAYFWVTRTNKTTKTKVARGHARRALLPTISTSLARNLAGLRKQSKFLLPFVRALKRGHPFIKNI